MNQLMMVRLTKRHIAVALLVVVLLLHAVWHGGSSLGRAIDTTGSSPIAVENTFPGTNAWQIPHGKASTIQIQAYAGAPSVLPGQNITFYVSTLTEGMNYSIELYRLGWYNGRGGRLMDTRNKLIAHAQGYYDAAIHRLVACKSCLIDQATGLIEANWQPSYMLTIPRSWTSGVYLAKFTEGMSGFQTYVPFDVRGNLSSTYVAVTSDTTFAAYNDWGGYSLYAAENDYGPPQKSVKVSFDRPYEYNSGSGFVLNFEISAIHWLERQGYNLSYISNVDLHEAPGQLLNHRAYLSLGHDEYWSKEIRDGVEKARDSGRGLAILGANAAYWQIRFEPDHAGAPDRTVVCYKVETAHHDLARDPLYGNDNSRVTTQWRDPLLNRPENALLGIMYSDLTDGTKRRGFPWQVASGDGSSLLADTGLVPGKQYGCDLVGYEWDRVFDNGFTPKNLRVLATSPAIDENGGNDTSNTTSYVAPSGALVFASGSIYWTTALDSYRFSPDKACSSRELVVPGIQKLMSNVMRALIKRW